MRWLLTLGFLAFPCGDAFAKEPFAYSGFGSATCAEIARLHPADKTPMGVAVLSWAQGFMSGLNISHLAHKQPMRDLGDVTTGGQLAFLLNYCDKNQLDGFASAVLSLYGALPEIPQKN
ncbi:hypothetical protein LJR234_002157 [Mesorhizobium amorphae]|uniref:hypothetical protein n=1 Tax=Mesorhizobium amorphae TaxID=71433 RepID=UPI003ECE58B5